MIVSLLPFHCGFFFVLGCRVYFFGRFQCLPVDGCSKASCDFGALAEKDKCTSFYSVILDQSLSILSGTKGNLGSICSFPDLAQESTISSRGSGFF